MNISRLFGIFVSLCLLACAAEDQSASSIVSEAVHSSKESVLGKLEHGFTLNAGTQDKFDEGLLLLHNFEYDDALTAFEEATAIDSTEVMTHWGEAMCHYKALWRLQNTEKGIAILERFGADESARLASIKDPKEKDMWKIVELMYGEGELKERKKMISKHLAGLHKEYPENQEVAVFYALSLIWATETYGDGSEDLRLAASVADKVTKVNPKHPGALHYKIHALDGPTSAQDAHDAADAYAKVAADASHALHMPSHIYLAVGEWDGVVKSNQASYDASVARMEKLELKDGARGYHSYAWLHYALLQQGKHEQAEKLLADMLIHVAKDPTKGARGYLLGMQSRQLAESSLVSADISIDSDVKVDDIGIMAKSMRSFLRSQMAFSKKDINAIDDEIDWLKKKISFAKDLVTGDGIAMCAAGTSRYAPTDNSVKSAKVVLAQIKGMKALLEQKDTQFKKHMVEAIALEKETDFPAGPPRITKPSFEQYGEWLIAKGDYQEAIKQFDTSLERMPRRIKSLMGKLQAHQGLKNTDKAKEVQGEIDAILAMAR